MPVYASLSVNEVSSSYQYLKTSGFGVAGGFMTFGYRLQPFKTGFMMNMKWNLMIIRGSGFHPAWFSIGLGVGFK